MREIHTQPAPYVCKCLADADALSPDLEKLLRLVCPKPKKKKSPPLLDCSRHPAANKQQATSSSGKQTREAQELARVQPRPVPLHHTTPPFLGSARRKLVELSPNPPLFSKRRDWERLQIQASPATVSFASPSSYLESLRPAKPRPTPTPAEPPGNGALSRAQRELTQEASPGPRCLHRLTPFNLTPYS